MKTKNTFPNHLARSRKVLAWYDRQAKRREQLRETVEDDADLAAWLALEEKQLQDVREAFALDTKEINSRDNALLIDISTLRRWCAEAEKEGA